MSEKTRSERILQLVDVLGKLLLGIAGIWIGYVFHDQQQQLTVQIEETREELATRNIDIQKSQFAANLIEHLIDGSESEKLVAMSLLRIVDDSLALEVFQSLALHDPNVSVRLRAIERLGESGAPAALETLVRAGDTAPTESERDKAKKAQVTLRTTRAARFESELAAARSLLRASLWKEAADRFVGAAEYARPDDLDAAELALAKSHYEHEGYTEAARAFDALFPRP